MALKPKVRPKSKSKDSSRQLLLEGAKRLFAKKGYDGVSVKEIAKEAGLNISLVSYHFNGKENLYHECLTQFGESKLKVAQRVLQAPQSVQEFQIRFRMFLEEVMVEFLNDPDSMRIAFRESDLDNPISLQVFKETYVKVVQTIIDFIEKAQKKGFVEKSLDSFILSGILMSSIGRLVQFDHVCSKIFGNTLQDPKHRKKVIDHFIALFSKGIFIEEAK
jgi:AcrR family transcriptional regulator